jgi:UV DNA damage endonuclease
MLEFNLKHDLRFFRIGSEFVPFASHQLMSKLVSEKKFKWQEHFGEQLKEIGDFVRKHNMRIAMHPDHFCLLNSTSEDILNKSLSELEYHADIFECMQLDSTHKFQIHCGGVYGDKKKSMERLVERYNNKVSDRVKKHLVIENDDHLFSLDDCIWVSERTGIPILFDTLHHECLNTSGETQRQAFKRAAATWKKERDGIPMIDYSSQTTEVGAKRGKHTDSIDLAHFERVICNQIMRVEDDNGNLISCDIMLEIKDKEASGLKCIEMFQNYREKYYGEAAVRPPYTDEEKESEEKEIIVQAKISNRDDKGTKLPTPKKEKVKKETPAKRKTPIKKEKKAKRIKIEEEEEAEVSDADSDNDMNEVAVKRGNRSASKKVTE